MESNSVGDPPPPPFGPPLPPPPFLRCLALQRRTCARFECALQQCCLRALSVWNSFPQSSRAQNLVYMAHNVSHYVLHVKENLHHVPKTENFRRPGGETVPLFRELLKESGKCIYLIYSRGGGGDFKVKIKSRGGRGIAVRAPKTRTYPEKSKAKAIYFCEGYNPSRSPAPLRQNRTARATG
jgi:hypothetical protein